MLAGFIKFVIAVGIASFLSVLLVYAFDDWYQDLERRRRAKWQAKQTRSQHPSSSGPRYE